MKTTLALALTLAGARPAGCRLCGARPAPGNDAGCGGGGQREAWFVYGSNSQPEWVGGVTATKTISRMAF